MHAVTCQDRCRHFHRPERANISDTNEKHRTEKKNPTYNAFVSRLNPLILTKVPPSSGPSVGWNERASGVT